MTAGWSKGRSKRYGYYVCQHKGCSQRMKSIRKEKIEGAFEELARSLLPAEGLFAMAADMFRRLWERRLQTARQLKQTLGLELAKLDDKIDALTDRLMTSEVPSVITAYETQIGRLEVQKAKLRQKSTQSLEPQKSFEDMFGLACTFLANPWILWTKGGYHHKRLLLRMAFTDNLTYCREKGFIDHLNQKTSIIFDIYGRIAGKKSMVPGED